MNKVFLGLILTVCVLGMALVMLNDRLGRKNEPRSVASAVEAPLPVPPASPSEMEAEARAREIAEAARSLAGGLQNPETRAPAPMAEEVQQSQPEIVPEAPLAAQPLPEQIQAVPEARPQAEKPARAEARPQETQLPESRPQESKPVARQEARPDKAGVTHIISRFVIYARDKGATVRLGSTGKLEYTSMTLTNPDRVVVDLPGAWKFPAHPGVPKNELVSAVRVGQSGDKTRVVIDLKQTARKVLLVPFKNGDGVDVRIDK